MSAATDQALTLPHLLRAAAQRFGDRPAYVADDRVLTFRDLHDQVRTLARGFAALGLQPGGRVVLWAPNSIEWAIACFATSYAGGVLVPVNSRYVGSEVSDLTERTSAQLIVVADGFLDRRQIGELEASSDLADVKAVVRLPGFGPATVTPDNTQVVEFQTVVDLLAASFDGDIEARADSLSADDIADIMFTSGTTGRPKGVMSSHAQTIAVARSWGAVGGMSQADRYIGLSPFFHTFGYKAGMMVCLLHGSAMYPLATFDVDATMALIQDQRITVFPGAPAFFQAVLNASDRSDYDLSSLRLVVTGAAMVPVVLIERLFDDVGADTVLTAYGQTECVVATMARPGDSPALIANSCGCAVPGVETKIDANGELLLRGDVVMKGYLDDPEATSKSIDPDGWLHTGDIATMDDNGYVTITDRLKDMYICGGFNVYPAEVEQVLARLEGVTDVAVIGVPDERLGEVGAAFLVTSGTVTEEQVTAFANERLANFKRPRQIHFIDALPRNLGGKVLKTDLRGQQ